MEISTFSHLYYSGYVAKKSSKKQSQQEGSCEVAGKIIQPVLLFYLPRICSIHHSSRECEVEG